MQIEDRVIDSQERIGFLLRSLYAGCGYSRYRMSKFEEYDLYRPGPYRSSTTTKMCTASPPRRTASAR